jgi:hypothetical protein
MMVALTGPLYRTTSTTSAFCSSRSALTTLPFTLAATMVLPISVWMW